MNTNKIKSQIIWYYLVAGRSSSYDVIDEIWRYNCSDNKYMYAHYTYIYDCLASKQRRFLSWKCNAKLSCKCLYW